MAAVGADKDNASPLSSEFEDLGLEDEPSTSKSTGAGGESDWTEGGEEVSGARRGGSFSGAATPDTSQVGLQATCSQFPECHWPAHAVAGRSSNASSAKTQMQQRMLSDQIGAVISHSKMLGQSTFVLI